MPSASVTHLTAHLTFNSVSNGHGCHIVYMVMKKYMYIILISYLFLPLSYVELDTGKTSIWDRREKTCFSYSYVLALHVNTALKLLDLKKKKPKLSVF